MHQGCQNFLKQTPSLLKWVAILLSYTKPGLKNQGNIPVEQLARNITLVVVFAGCQQPKLTTYFDKKNILFIHLLLISSAESSSPAVVGEGIKTGSELGSSGEGDTLSDDDDNVSLALGSPENCKL